MPALGRACLILALAVAVYGVAASLYGARARRREWVDSGRRAVYALAGILTVAFAVLEAAFLRSDFSLDVVASHSSTATPAFYRASAMWSSQEGSLLLWVWLLSLWSSLILFATRRRVREIAPYATAVLLGIAGFFAALTVFLANPFALVSPVPAEGAGLNPLLRHPSMMIHPPLLYSGYTLFTVPFAFAIGALVARRLDAEWIAVTRRFALAAWLALGVGVLLGARWSYVELGWGGYWGWDPVENASLMPWLTGTALLHSVMIQEKRGMLKVWNVSLVAATGILAVLGTFLVRSGILDSIHAFGASTLGVPFLALIAVMVIGSVALVVARRRELRTDQRLDSLLSREAVFLFNNLVLVGLCFVVFWGTFFPLLSEAVTGTEASVGGPFFASWIVPLSLALVALSGIGPVVAWRVTTPAALWRGLRLPLAAGLVTLAALVAAGGVAARPAALAMFCLAAFVAAVVIQELWRGARARQAVSGQALPAALTALVGRNRHRYGGYVVHLGIAVMFAGVAASSAFQQARDVRLAPGQSARVGGYEIAYVRPVTTLSGEKLSLGAVLDLRRDGRTVERLTPSRGYYPAQDAGGRAIERFFDGQATSEVALKAGFTRDVWAAVEPDVLALAPVIREADRRFPRASPELQGLLIAAIAQRYESRPPPATFRLIVSPLVSWIWLGALILVGGALIALWPAPVAARAPRRVLGGARAGARAPGRA